MCTYINTEYWPEHSFKNTRKHLFLINLQALETPTQVFSCEYSEIYKNIYFKKNLRMAASVLTIMNFIKSLCPFNTRTKVVFYKKTVIKNFAIRPAIILKRGTYTGVFL